MARGLEPIKRVALTDAVIEQLYNLMVSGQVEPGDKLPSESDLSNALDVGRSTIREALRALSALGLVSRTKRGTFVSEQSSSRIVEALTRGRLVKQTQLADLTEARQVLETSLAYMAAGRCTEEDLEKIKVTFLVMKHNVNNVESFIRADTDFHLSVAEAAQNDVLLKMLGVLRELLMEAMAEAISADPTIMDRAVVYHARILDAIESEDPEAAQKAMREHLQDVWKVTRVDEQPKDEERTE